MLCWIDGKFLKARDLKINPFDYGLLYGYNIFEIFRTYKGKVVFFQEHFNRLTESLMNFQITMPYSIDQIKEAIEQLTKKDKSDAVVHLCVLAGENFIIRKKHYKPKVLILRSPLNKKDKNDIRLTWCRYPWMYDDSNVKFHGQKLWIPHENLDVGAIYYTEKDIIVGGIYSTIFWAKNGILYTPRMKEDNYCDITRKWVLITARQLGLKTIEDVFVRYELDEAYECFLTNSVDGIVPISQINDKKFLGKEGPVYELLHHAYLEEIFQIM